MEIINLMHRIFYDNKRQPIIQGGIFLKDGTLFTGCVPAADFTGILNECEAEKTLRLCEQALAPSLIGKDIRIPDIDFLLIDATAFAGIPIDDFSINRYFTLALSIAVYKAYACKTNVELYELFAYLMGSESVTLPCPQFTVLTDQKQTRDLRIREFSVTPLGAATVRSAFELCMSVAGAVHENPLYAHGVINQAYDDREILDFLGMTLGKIAFASDAGICALALNIDASKFYDKEHGKYFFNHTLCSAEELINFYGELTETYPVYSIEDGLDHNDWEKWRLMTETLGNKTQIVGNALFSSDPERLNFIARNNIATAIAIKPYACSTILEIMQSILACKQNKLNIIIAHPFGEAEDAFMTDLTIGTSAGQIKIGSCPPSEWLARYERLFAVENALRGISS